MIPIQSVIIFIVLLISIIYVLYYLSQKERQIYYDKKKQLREEQNKDNEKQIFKGFMLKNAIIAGALAFLIGLRVRDFLTTAIDTIINPLFEIDLDNDGQPDFSEITNLATIKLFGLKFSFGPLILSLIKFLCFVASIYIIIIMIYQHTDYISV